MSRGGSKLNKTQERAIAALLTSPNHDDAAKAAGVSASTLTRWLRIPEFMEAYRLARRQVVEFAITKTQEASTEAVRTLCEAMRADRPSDRIRAAEIILRMAVGGVEFADVLDRVESLERSLNGEQDAGQGEGTTGEAGGGS